MRVKFYFLSAIFFLLFTANTQAQNWVNGGNSLTANGSIGIKSNYSLIFTTANVERGRILNTGNWAIGTTSAYSKLTVNTGANTSPFLANINNVTKLQVHSNGGTSIGSAAGGPVDGLYVAGSVGIGVTAPTSKLHVVTTGSIAVYGQGGSYGLYGSSGYIGAYGYGTSFGVYGSSGSYGVYGSGTSYGVYGSGKYGVYGSGSSYGVYGNSFYGIYGNSTSGYGAVFTSGGHGIDATSTSTAGNIYGGVFHHNVYVYGTVSQTSDRRVKKNITDVKNAMDIISRLKPSYYEFKHEGEFASLNLPMGKHYGLIAQDLEEVLPELVSPAPLGDGGDTSATSLAQREATSSFKGGKGINYTELIPIMIKGMQEQDSTMQAKVTKLEQEVAELKEIIKRLDGNRGSEIVSSAWIKQNNPNPFNGSATIQYFVPLESKNARIEMTDIKGQLLKYWNLSNGEGTVMLNGGTLSAGTYNYSLIIEGKIITTKKMIIAR